MQCSRGALGETARLLSRRLKVAAALLPKDDLAAAAAAVVLGRRRRRQRPWPKRWESSWTLRTTKARCGSRRGGGRRRRRWKHGGANFRSSGRGSACRTRVLPRSDRQRARRGGQRAKKASSASLTAKVNMAKTAKKTAFLAGIVVGRRKRPNSRAPVISPVRRRKTGTTAMTFLCQPVPGVMWTLPWLRRPWATRREERMRPTTLKETGVTSWLRKKIATEALQP
mmetsp:Transcript_21098/g.38285  ORF Transcript_21098/g.38285 Transcript_21098/m.38285 type:complete len:226 (+) Transcript_21098:199-876(+)